MFTLQLAKLIHCNSLLAIAHAQYHMTYLQGVDINHIFEIRDPYFVYSLCNIYGATTQINN